MYKIKKNNKATHEYHKKFRDVGFLNINRYVSIDTLKDAVSRNHVDALAFSIQIKFTFRNSVLLKKTIAGRKMKSFAKEYLYMGMDKAKKLLNQAIAAGYMKDMGDYYVAVPLKRTGQNFNVKIQNCLSYKKYKGDNGIINEYLVPKHKDIKNELYKGASMLKVKGRNYVSYMIKSKLEPTSISQYKKCDRALKRLGIYDETTVDSFTGEKEVLDFNKMSLKYLSKSLGVKDSRGGRIMRQLAEEGRIMTVSNYDEVKALSIKDPKSIPGQLSFYKSMLGGNIMFKDGKILTRKANSYFYDVESDYFVFKTDKRSSLRKKGVIS